MLARSVRCSPVLYGVLVCVCTGGCNPPGSSGIGTTSQSIVDGETDRGHPAVGVLASGSSRCSATLVGRKTVLTAAHCIQSTAVEFALCAGSSECDTTSAETYGSALVMMHPAYAGGAQTHDLALIVLERAVVDVDPVSVGTEAPEVGQAITIVGFGAPGFGTRRVGTNTIAAVAKTQFQFNGSSGVDHGDSGGPTFVAPAGQDVQIGVHSTKGLRSGSGGVVVIGTDTRVDAFLSWVLDVSAGDVALAGAGLPSGGNLPSEPAGEGESCMNRTCAQRFACVTVFDSGRTQERGRFCLERCSAPGASDPACDGEEECVASRSAGNVCFLNGSGATGFTNIVPGEAPPQAPSAEPDAGRPAPEPDAGPTLDPEEETESGSDPSVDPTPGAAKRQFGDVCETAEDCASNVCALEPATKVGYCTRACSPDRDPCNGGAVCQDNGAGDGQVCSPPALEGAAALTGPSEDRLDADQRLTGGCRSADPVAARPGDAALLLVIGLLACRGGRLRSRRSRPPR